MISMSLSISVQWLSRVIHQAHVSTQQKVLPVRPARPGYGVHLSLESVWNMLRVTARYSAFIWLKIFKSNLRLFKTWKNKNKLCIICICIICNMKIVHNSVYYKNSKRMTTSNILKHVIDHVMHVQICITGSNVTDQITCQMTFKYCSNTKSSAGCFVYRVTGVTADFWFHKRHLLSEWMCILFSASHSLVLAELKFKLLRLFSLLINIMSPCWILLSIIS